MKCAATSTPPLTPILPSLAFHATSIQGHFILNETTRFIYQFVRFINLDKLNTPALMYLNGFILVGVWFITLGLGCLMLTINLIQKKI